MGKRGPKPLPSAIKRARGTFQPCRESGSEPIGERVLPECPEDLDDEERAEWKRLGERLLGMGILHDGHGDALVLLVCSKLRYRRLRAQVAEVGEVIEEDGRLKRNPAAIALEKAQSEYRRMLGEFGITPSAATRVVAERAGGIGAVGPDAVRPFGVLAGTRKAQ